MKLTIMGGRWTTTSSVCLTVSIWGNIIRFSFASPELEFLPDLLQPLVKREISIWRQEQGSPSVQTCFTFYADLFHITFIPYIICWGVFSFEQRLILQNSYRALGGKVHLHRIALHSFSLEIKISNIDSSLGFYYKVSSDNCLLSVDKFTLEVGETNQTFTILGTNSNSHQTIEGNT